MEVVIFGVDGDRVAEEKGINSHSTIYVLYSWPDNQNQNKKGSWMARFHRRANSTVREES